MGKSAALNVFNALRSSRKGTSDLFDREPTHSIRFQDGNDVFAFTRKCVGVFLESLRR